MKKKLVCLIAVAVWIFSTSTIWGQNLPVLNMGFSGAGIGSDLLKVIDRSALWRKYGLEVRTVYLSSGTLMAQTLSSGDIGIAGFDTPARGIGYKRGKASPRVRDLWYCRRERASDRRSASRCGACPCRRDVLEYRSFLAFAA